MTAWPTSAAHADLHARGRALAARLALVLHAPRGHAGSAAGRGAGASVEIEDHRPFVLGDDPRHVDWNAYGRTGQWIAKTFRAEVSPAVDLAFDASRSMAVWEDKRSRALETFYVVFEAARRVGAQVRTHVVLGDEVRPVPADGVLSGRWLEGEAPADRPQTPNLARVRWRADALRIWVSDLLYPGAPQAVLQPLAIGAGRAVVLAPAATHERRPAWQGNLTLVDAESGEARAEHVDAATLSRLAAAYDAHFAAYTDAAIRLGVALARVPAEGPLGAALVREGVPRGVFQSWS